MNGGRTTLKLTGWSTFVRTAAYQISVKNLRKLQMVINRLINAGVNKFTYLFVLDP